MWQLNFIQLSGSSTKMLVKSSNKNCTDIFLLLYLQRCNHNIFGKKEGKRKDKEQNLFELNSREKGGVLRNLVFWWKPGRQQNCVGANEGFLFFHSRYVC